VVAVVSFCGAAAAPGFTLNLSFYGDRDVNLRALAQAAQAGLKLIVHDARLDKVRDEAARPLSELDAVIADYRNQPAFWGYYIMDEPNAVKFERLGRIVAYLKDRDPAHPAYVNLFPTYASHEQLGTETYEEHLAAYVRTVRPDFISYDHYPVTSSGLRPDYFRNLETIRRAALEAEVPFWAFTLSVAHAVYPQPQPGHIRLQLFSDLAYGARGLQYFTYGSPRDDTYNFSDGLIDRAGRPTPLYGLAREVNAEVRAWAPFLVRLRSDAVFHADPVPDGGRAFPGSGPVRGVKGASLLAGLFRDGKTMYVMFVNRDYEREAEAVVIFGPEVAALAEIPKTASPPAAIRWPAAEEERTCVLRFRPGDARFFEIKGR